MARETKLGIALMVLLVGVFGFMVYKKWNSRQPTVLAAAEEVKAADDKGADQKAAAAPSQESESPPAVSPAESAPPQFATSTNPFGRPNATVPPHQAEPGTAFADEPFVRDAAARELPANDTTAMTADPFPQSEPAVAETEPVFAEPTGAPAQDATTLDAEAFVEATPESQPATTPSPDPFASAAGTATSTRETDVTAESNPSSAAPDVPFAESAGTAAVTNADPEALLGEATLSEAASSEVSSSALASTPTVQPDFVESGETADQAAVASTDNQTTADPFADAQPASAAPIQPQPEAGPARLFAEGSIGIEPESLALAEDADALSEQATAAAATTTVTPVARTQGQSYVVVGENDSYWALSKRAYGTPAYFHALAKYNSSRIKDPNRLKAGMKVVTPEPQELESLFPHLISRTASGNATAQEAKAGLSWNEEGVPIYRVGDSDTLTGIAQAHLGRASRWVQIYEMNRKAVSDPKTLKPGTVLQLPADASRVRLVPQG